MLKTHMLSVSMNNFTVHPVLLDSDKEAALIDCGFIGTFDILIEEIKKRISIQKLTKILLTHHDHDHIANLYLLKQKLPTLKILCGRDEEKYINGTAQSLRLTQAMDIQPTLPEEKKAEGLEFIKMLESIAPVSVDEIISDGDILNPYGIIAISTPGHVQGHMSYYIPSLKTLVAGDALYIENGKLAIPMPQYAFNLEEAMTSINKLSNYDIKEVICYHGGKINVNKTDFLSINMNNK